MRSFVLSIALLPIIWYLATSRINFDNMTSCKYTAQKGYFSHDSDPESWDFRAVTLPGLGLLDRDFSSVSASNEDRSKTTWERFQKHVHELNQKDPNSRQYKVFYIMRHGEGVHNVKEREIGRAEWDVSIIV